MLAGDLKKQYKLGILGFLIKNTKNIHPSFQGDQSWLAEAGCGHPNSLGCGGRQDLEPQRGPGARRQGLQEVEGAAGLDRGLASGGGRCDYVGCDGYFYKVQFPELF